MSRPYGAACDIGAYEYTGDVFPDAMLAPSITSENIATPTFTLTNTSSAHSCTFTAIKNLFCRSGPGSSIYPALDSLSVGEFADVVGQSADGQFVYLVAPHTSGFCVVPTGSNFGTLAGDACSSLAVFTPPPPPTSTPTFVNLPDSNPSQPGCTVMKLSSGIPECVVPCPEGAIPGKPCTP